MLGQLGLSRSSLYIELLRDGFGERPYFHVLIAEWASDDGLQINTAVDPAKPSTSMPHDEKIVGHALYFYSYCTLEGKCLYLEDLCVREEFRSECVCVCACVRELVCVNKCIKCVNLLCCCLQVEVLVLL